MTPNQRAVPMTPAYVDVDPVFWALCRRVDQMGGSGPLGVLADAMRVVLAAFDGEEWALDALRHDPAWQLDANHDLP